MTVFEIRSPGVHLFFYYLVTPSSFTLRLRLLRIILHTLSPPPSLSLWKNKRMKEKNIWCSSKRIFIIWLRFDLFKDFRETSFSILMHACTLSLQIDLISRRCGSQAVEGWGEHGINPRIIPFGAVGLYFADRVRSRIHWIQTRERINMSLVHYLSNCLKLPRRYAKVRGSPVTPVGWEHVTLRITRDRKSVIH